MIEKKKNNKKFLYMALLIVLFFSAVSIAMISKNTYKNSKLVTINHDNSIYIDELSSNNFKLNPDTKIKGKLIERK